MLHPSPDSERPRWLHARWLRPRGARHAPGQRRARRWKRQRRQWRRALVGGVAECPRRGAGRASPWIISPGAISPWALVLPPPARTLSAPPPPLACRCSFAAVFQVVEHFKDRQALRDLRTWIGSVVPELMVRPLKRPEFAPTPSPELSSTTKRCAASTAVP